ncbi:hypothetical protein ACHQM5_009315 [Ranunculus cassubicifolius]
MGEETEIHHDQHDSNPTPPFEFQIPNQGTQSYPQAQHQAELLSGSVQAYPAQQFSPQANTQDSDSGYMDQPPTPNFPQPIPQQFQPQANPQQFPPQASPQQFPPQSRPQQFPTQAGYYQSTQPMQSGPQTFPPQLNPQGYPQPQTYYPYNQNVGAQMHQTGAPAYPISTGTMPWKTDLFDCMDDPNNAIITFCFPCVTFGQIAEIVEHGQTTCATSGFLYGCIAAFIGVPCLISCGYRSKLRSKYDLVEVPAADWITHCFCEWCALCQEYRELKIRGLDPAIGWQGNLMRIQNMQQQQQGVMMMPPVQHVMR